WECYIAIVNGVPQQGTEDCKWVPDLSEADPSGLSEHCPEGWHSVPVYGVGGTGGTRCIPGRQAGDYVKEPKDRERDDGSGFTLGIRAPGQTYRQCMSANSSNYSLNTFTGTDNFLLSNDVTGLLFGDRAEALAGLMVWEGGSHSFEAGVGTVMTAGRR